MICFCFVKVFMTHSLQFNPVLLLAAILTVCVYGLQRPSVWSWLKYLNYHWLDCLKIFYRHSYFPENESCWLQWPPDFSCSSIIRSKVKCVQYIVLFYGQTLAKPHLQATLCLVHANTVNMLNMLTLSSACQHCHVSMPTLAFRVTSMAVVSYSCLLTVKW